MSMSKGRLVRALVLLVSLGAIFSWAAPQSWATVANVDDDSYKKEVEDSALPVFIDFYAVWCGPCKKIAPFLDELSTEYSGKIKFVRIDVEKAPKSAERFNAEELPTLILRSKKLGKGVAITGYRSKEDLKTFIEDALKKVQ